MDKEKCINCKHCLPCRHLNFKTHEWEWFNVCILFADDFKEAWGITVTDDDFCECFEPR